MMKNQTQREKIEYILKPDRTFQELKDLLLTRGKKGKDHAGSVTGNVSACLGQWSLDMGDHQLAGITVTDTRQALEYTQRR